MIARHTSFLLDMVKRQGDPLLLFLFILAMEGLHFYFMFMMLFSRLQQEKNITNIINIFKRFYQVSGGLEIN